MQDNLIKFISDSLDLEYKVNVITDGDFQTLVLYDGVESVDYEIIDNHTFFKNSDLGSICAITSIVIPKTVTNINCYALNKCKWLESIIVSEDNETYSSLDGVLYNKNKTKLCYVPPKVKLTELVLPDTVTEIDTNAFLDSLQSENDETLMTLVIHKDVTLINVGNCNVKSIIVSEDNETYSTQDGVLFNKDKTKLYRFPERSPLTEYEIPDTVTEIAERALNCCKNLKSVIIPSSVKRIGYMAFSHCMSLESVVIPDGITEIDYATFEFCCNLKSVAIPNSVTIIKENVFLGCSGLGSIVIPDNVIEIEERAFLYSGLKEVMVSKNTIIGKKTFENNLFDEPKINYY